MPGAAPANPMSFFVTSANPGKGADFGGLAGADRHCQALASAAGAGGRTWRAYLSTTAAGGAAAINARDRIGSGPWRNVKGVMVAANVEELHGTNNLSKQTALNEKGEVVSGGGDPVNTHDILTGSGPDGRASAASNDTTCGNWTKSGEGSAIVGHHDRRGVPVDGNVHVLEFLPCHARLQHGCAQEHRQCGLAVLLRDELSTMPLCLPGWQAFSIFPPAA